MTSSDALVNLLSDFASRTNWEEKYRLIIKKGKDLEPYPEEFRQDEYKVKGCQSQVWLYPREKKGRIIFFGDSDASIVRGLMAIVLTVYSGRSPKEILETPPDFIDRLGLRQNLSMSRANGLGSMLKQIKLYALAFTVKARG